ncbi:MAG: ELM1/GtrOC1 family putative glycosyltransferase [Geminicoccaceae bacterium]
MSTDLLESWPYFREHPDLIRLDVVEGVQPSDKPPVRIFLGTEDGQYRAERIFVYTIVKHRDPARIYEIYLMKNLTGFDRRAWRTGFTNYRFAIPSLAGGTGKAIYNDVDQIYFVDPALLFDLDLGDHGYLAISAKDTSVMLIDCTKMLPIWNRERASHAPKHELTNKPADTPGLWGLLDGHWNARDLEYVEGRTMCLHYTALHQQPWHPFPGAFSYHPNPLAYLFYDLEREADAEGFRMFDRERPSPGFDALLGSNRPLATPKSAPLDEGTQRLLEAIGTWNVTYAALGAALDAKLPFAATRVDLARSRGRLPEGKADAVIAAGVFETVPGADIEWIMDELFAHANKAVVVSITAQPEGWLGSADWWLRRIKESAQRHPGISWRLEVGEPQATGSIYVRATEVRAVTPPATPRVWVVTGGEAARDADATALAAALGWPFEVKAMVYGGLSILPNAVIGASLGGVDKGASPTLEAPWPDLVITSGRKAVPVARWILARAGKPVKLVQLGRPAAPFDLFDLIVAPPEEKLPERPNVLQTQGPLGAAAISARGTLPEAVARLPRPLTAVFVSETIGPYTLGTADAHKVGRTGAENGGSVVVCADQSVTSTTLDAVRAGVGGPVEVVRTPTREDGDVRAALLAAADRLVVTAGDTTTLLAASTTGKPVTLYDLPRWYEAAPVLGGIVKALQPLLAGKTYRGTPLQQHIPGRFIDWLATRGLQLRPRSLDELHRSLEARGVVVRAGTKERVAQPKPLDDAARVAARIRRIMTELPQAG